MSPEVETPDVYAPPANPRRAPRAVYIHVPFCLHRCGYCDFTLVAQKDELIPAWFEALRNELGRLDRRYPVDSIFVGGGTPTHLSPRDLELLGQLIDQHFQLMDGGEYSVEANPDGLDKDRLATLQQIGVNRLSLGVQSFDDDVLKTLERQHTGTQAREAIERAQSYVQNLSLDLIFGVPGQSADSWLETMATATSLPVTHISTYGLTFEKGTDFFRRRLHGDLTAVDDRLERDMYAAGIDALAVAGLEHYEVSNFATREYRCRHNLVYWSANEYFAFGPGAARYVNGVRSTNSRNVSRWINAWLTETPALQDWEQLDRISQAREAIFLGLRLCAGFDLPQFESRFEVSIEELAGEELTKHVQLGNLEEVSGNLRLTQTGRFVADSVICDFL